MCLRFKKHKIAPFFAYTFSYFSSRVSLWRLRTITHTGTFANMREKIFRNSTKLRNHSILSPLVFTTAIREKHSWLWQCKTIAFIELFERKSYSLLVFLYDSQKLENVFIKCTLLLSCIKIKVKESWEITIKTHISWACKQEWK